MTADSETRDARRRVHTIRNAINTIAMNAELARLAVRRADEQLVERSVDIVLEQCARCSTELEALGKISDDH